jgi:ubiquitin carboxyl-terminal hydrolase 9/24
VNTDLFLIDENIAIAFCYYEFIDILKKIFCMCTRGVKLYLVRNFLKIQHHDQNIKTYATMVTKKQEKNFVETRIKNDIELDDIKIMVYRKMNVVFGQFINFINYFATLGGFEAILTLLKYGSNPGDAEKVPLELIALLTSPFRNCIDILEPAFTKSFVLGVQCAVISRFTKMDEKELKDIDKDLVSKILNDMKDFLLLFHPEEDTDKIIESTQLFMALQFLKSSYLEKRLKGLNEIKMMIERTDT